MDSNTVILGIYVAVFFVLLVIGFLLKGERFSMYQEATGKTIEVKRGFSFTYLFFGPFVPLFRGHIGGFFLSLFIELCSCGFARWILLFCYNGMYINWLAKNGYRRLGVQGSGSGSQGMVNIQIQSGNGAAAEPVVEPKRENVPESGQKAEKEKREWKLPKLPFGGEKETDVSTGGVLKPVNGDGFGAGDDGETRMPGTGALICTSGVYEGGEFSMDGDTTITIGRDAAQSNLVIPDKAISRLHCEISYDSFRQCYTVTDSSTNGVFLQDGSQMAQGQPVYLYPGDTIRIGKTKNIFQLK